MPIPFPFDFKKPDYNAVFQWRYDRLCKIRKKPSVLAGMYQYYSENPGQFITDWGMTFDPRNVEIGLPAYCPFILFPRQEEAIHWIIERWKNREPGLADKSREMGMSWLTIAFACTMALFHDGFSMGFGSRKQEYVDKLGDLKAILPKGRMFMSLLPVEFRRGWTPRDAPHMRIQFPETQAFISGESGDGIGRGDRVSIYVVDESAWLPRPQLVEESLSNTTNCRIDVSTPRGMGNPFGRKRFAGKISVFSMHWSEDPRKDQAWYDKKCLHIDDPVVIAQELDLDYSASMEGVLIPALWVQAALDAHIKLGLKPKGLRKMGLDIADEGKDKNAVCGRYGILIEYLEQWSGKGGDIYKTLEKVCDLADILDYRDVAYDSDGLGAGARGDARVINEKRKKKGDHKIRFRAFRGSGRVLDPEKDPFVKDGEERDAEKGRTNEDYFKNAKAQAWWSLRRRFLYTYRAVVLDMPYNPEHIISIPRTLKECHKLVTELSQPTYKQNDVGQIIVNKDPDGMASPNLADSIMIAFARLKRPKGFFSAKRIDSEMDD